jgi:hypothetical protein
LAARWEHREFAHRAAPKEFLEAPTGWTGLIDSAARDRWLAARAALLNDADAPLPSV